MRTTCGDGWLPDAAPPSAMRIIVPPGEYSISAIRAQGAGGQNVNKVSNAVHLRFDVRASSLSEELKARVLALSDRRLSEAGVLVIKAQGERSLEKNRSDAVARLHALIQRVASPPRPRRATKPSAASKRARIDDKVRRGVIKTLRGKVSE